MSTNATDVRAVDPDLDVADVFWDGCANREFWLQHCTACDKWQFYPRTVCSHCWADVSHLEWRHPSGSAGVESFSVVHRGSGSFAAYAPYAVALVRLEEGPTMMTHIVGDTDDLAIGDTVRLEFAERAERMVPVFARSVLGAASGDGDD